MWTARFINCRKQQCMTKYPLIQVYTVRSDGDSDVVEPEEDRMEEASNTIDERSFEILSDHMCRLMNHYPIDHLIMSFPTRYQHRTK
ncbi:hypothetical protein DPMN_094786 [Dreissena polymorpha]|uniref:Uncharacterized protein n=1 Tax=Dreissena polymorpha TaxID=45954 RepID=A0A9D4R2Z0_DREPO|nr:hypothetical protein DPMN_094786 [Dreissena polymorpha]